MFRPDSDLNKLLAKFNDHKHIFIIHIVNILHEEVSTILELSIAHNFVLFKNLSEIRLDMSINEISAFFLVYSEDNISTFVDISGSTSDLGELLFNLVLIFGIDLVVLALLLD